MKTRYLRERSTFCECVLLLRYCNLQNDNCFENEIYFKNVQDLAKFIRIRIVCTMRNAQKPSAAHTNLYICNFAKRAHPELHRYTACVSTIVGRVVVVVWGLILLHNAINISLSQLAVPEKFGTPRQDFNHLKIALGLWGELYGKSTILTESFGAEMQECKVDLKKKNPDAHRAAGMKVRENERCMW